MAKYELKDRTPESMRCVAGACNRIYELCIFAGCPSISEQEGKYIIIGRALNQAQVNELGLAQKIGEGEAIIEVPKGLIDHLKDKA